MKTEAAFSARISPKSDASTRAKKQIAHSLPIVNVGNSNRPEGVVSLICRAQGKVARPGRPLFVLYDRRGVTGDLKDLSLYEKSDFACS